MSALNGKAALVTGCASGIGRAISILFSREGASVLGLDLNQDRGEHLAAAIRSAGGQCVFQPGDASRSEDCRTAVDRAVHEFGGLDILVNNAGVICRSSVVDLCEETWDRVMAVNVKSVFLMSKHAIPSMFVRGGGTIINVASGWGLTGGPKAAAYCASKGAVVLLTKAMALDYSSANIRVNCLCPGDTDTPMLRAEAAQLGEPIHGFLEQARNRPLGRVGRPEEIAQAALFLAGDASSFVAGAALVVDGGGLAG